MLVLVDGGKGIATGGGAVKRQQWKKGMKLGLRENDGGGGKRRQWMRGEGRG